MKPVLVVEGTSDVNRLRNLVDCDFVITNGSAISKDTLNYLKELIKNRRVIVFTDPDYPGQKIRQTITKEIPNVEHCYIRKEFAVKGKKLGVCECDKDELLRALSQVLSHEKVKYEEGHITQKELLELKLIGENDSSKRRDYISKFIPIGKTNGKTFLKRINQLAIEKERLDKWMEEYDSK